MPNEDQLAESITPKCTEIIFSMSKDTKKCLDSLNSIVKNLKYFSMGEYSNIDKFRITLFNLYICLHVAFIKEKTFGSTENIQNILQKINKVILILEKTRSLSNKCEILNKISKSMQIIKTESNSTENINKPKISNLIAKRNLLNQNTHENTIENSQASSDLYIPPKDMFVPYKTKEFEHKPKISSKDKIKHKLISETLTQDHNGPLEIKNQSIDDLLTNKKIRIPQIDSKLKYMDEDLDFEHLADGFPLQKLLNKKKNKPTIKKNKLKIKKFKRS